MPSQETTQPKAQQMAIPAAKPTTEQPHSAEAMTAEPMNLRGGDGGEICCGLCAAFVCFECCKECCCCC